MKTIVEMKDNTKVSVATTKEGPILMRTPRIVFLWDIGDYYTPFLFPQNLWYIEMIVMLGYQKIYYVLNFIMWCIVLFY